MTKLTTSQYAIFMIAALTILITVPSAYANTLVLDASCLNKNEKNGTCKAPDNEKYIWLSAAIGKAESGDTISIKNGTYDNDLHQITIGKPLTIQSASPSDRVTFSGPVNIRITSDDVTIKGITFKNTSKAIPSDFQPAPVINIANGLSDITIHNNTFRDTNGHGIRIELKPETDFPMKNLTVTDNVFKNIGTFTKPHDSRAEKAFTAIHLVGNIAGSALGIKDSKITGNTIDTTTGYGIGLGNAENILVQDNTISNVPASAITVRLGGNQMQILDNYIHNANSAVGHNEVPENERKGGSVIFWTAGGLTNITFSNNIISGGNNGIVNCAGICKGANLDHLAGARNNLDELNATRDNSRTNIFTHNTFDNVKGFDIINRATGPMIAPLNYYGSPASPLVQNVTDPTIRGDVVYGPWYADASLTQIAVSSGSQQTQISAYNTCSVALEKSSLDLPLSEYGKTSGIDTQGVTNAGSAELSAIEVRVSDWTDNTGSTVPDVHSEVKPRATTSWNVVKPGSSVEITENLPQPRDGSSKLSLDYRVDMTGNSNGPSGPIKQTVTYIADCS